MLDLACCCAFEVEPVQTWQLSLNPSQEGLARPTANVADIAVYCFAPFESRKCLQAISMLDKPFAYLERQNALQAGRDAKAPDSVRPSLANCLCRLCELAAQSLMRSA